MDLGVNLFNLFAGCGKRLVRYGEYFHGMGMYNSYKRCRILYNKNSYTWNRSFYFDIFGMDFGRKNKLSLCIATYNEEQCIQYPLDSALDLVDEVILVDGGSEDATVDKACAYGKKVRVYTEENPQMFHINKQKALEYATGDWIIQLDADEALSDELKEEIRSVLSVPEGSEGGPVAYWVPRKNFFLTRFLEKGGVYPDYTIRFYKRGSVYFPCESVHENVALTGNLASRKDSIDYLQSPILHYADPTFSRYLQRWDRYTSIDAANLRKQNVGPSFFSYFVIKPVITFFRMYLRHKGFQDGFPGFVFSLFSSIRYWVIYIKTMCA